MIPLSVLFGSKSVSLIENQALSGSQFVAHEN